MLTKTEIVVVILMVLALIFIVYEMGQGGSWTLQNSAFIKVKRKAPPGAFLMHKIYLEIPS